MPMWEAMWKRHRRWEFLHESAHNKRSCLVLEFEPRLEWLALISKGQARQCESALQAMINENVPTNVFTAPGTLPPEALALELDWFRNNGGGHPETYAIYLSVWIESLLHALNAEDGSELRFGHFVSFWASLDHLRDSMRTRQTVPTQSPAELANARVAVAQLIEEYEYKSDPDIC